MARRAATVAGYACAAAGVVGLLLTRHLYVLWGLLIGIGIGAMPRAGYDWYRHRRSR